jgi:hypothetical protein
MSRLLEGNSFLAKNPPLSNSDISYHRQHSGIPVFDALDLAKDLALLVWIRRPILRWPTGNCSCCSSDIDLFVPMVNDH